MINERSSRKYYDEIKDYPVEPKSVINRRRLFQAVMDNIRKEDVEHYEKTRCVPISWLLARVTYEEATALMQMKRAQNEASKRYRVR